MIRLISQWNLNHALFNLLVEWLILFNWLPLYTNNTNKKSMTKVKWSGWENSLIIMLKPIPVECRVECIFFADTLSVVSMFSDINNPVKIKPNEAKNEEAQYDNSKRMKDKEKQIEVRSFWS